MTVNATWSWRLDYLTALINVTISAHVYGIGQSTVSSWRHRPMSLLTGHVTSRLAHLQIAIIVSKMTSHCAGTVQMKEESESGIRKWEEMWFKTTAEDEERGDSSDVRWKTVPLTSGCYKWHRPIILNCFWDIKPQTYPRHGFNLSESPNGNSHVTIRLTIYDFLRVLNWNPVQPTLYLQRTSRY